jgi:hypothetical protein
MSTRRRSFKPKRAPKTQRVIGDELVVTKGEQSIRISLAEFRQCLQKLRKVSNVQIRHLTDDSYPDPTNPGGQPLTGLDSCLKQIIKNVNILYPTQFFPMVHKQIQEIFADVQDVKPGTVGAYMVGCLLPMTSPHAPGCSLLCASSIPPPEETPDFKFCEHAVMWAQWDPTKNEYVFTEMNNVPDKTNTIVYVPSTSMSSFQGFSESEKNDLGNYPPGENRSKIRNISLMHQAADGQTAEELTSGFVSLNDIPTRSGNYTPKAQSKTMSDDPPQSGGMNSGLMALLIIGLIVLLILAFYSYKRCSKGPGVTRAVRVTTVPAGPIL